MRVAWIPGGVRRVVEKSMLFNCAGEKRAWREIIYETRGADGAVVSGARATACVTSVGGNDIRVPGVGIYSSQSISGAAGGAHSLRENRRRRRQRRSRRRTSRRMTAGRERAGGERREENDGRRTSRRRAAAGPRRARNKICIRVRRGGEAKNRGRAGRPGRSGRNKT